MKSRLTDWIMERSIAACGVLVAVMVVGILGYLTFESRFAFDRRFPYGYRFAVVNGSQAKPGDLSLDPNSSLLTANPEGADGPDEKEQGILMPSLEELSGTNLGGTGTALTGELARVDHAALYRDDWRSMKPATQGDSYLLFAFATPECREKTIRLAWQPDTGFDPASSPYRMRLRLLRAPAGAEVPEVDIDLTAKSTGSVDLPAWVARNDEDRSKGYIFELTATPTYGNNAMATVAGLFRSDWGPTSQYPKFGLLPLLYGTLAITAIAMLFATPAAVLVAVFLSEIARSRLREWLKPVIELLASIPTVVLGYFGLMLLAPALVKTFKSGLGMESGRSVLTAGIVMAVLILPTIISVAEDALRAVPGSLRDGAEALGLVEGETVWKVVVPAARAGIVAAALLGFARAIGETMIVWILAGGTPGMPGGSLMNNLVQPVRGIPDTIAIEMGNVEFEKAHYGHLFLLGVLLFILTGLINFVGHAYGKRRAWQA